MADSKCCQVYAGFWLRVWATLIDSTLLLCLLLPLAELIPGAAGPAVTPRLLGSNGQVNYAALAAGIPGPVQVLLFWILPAAVVVIFWLSRAATPGKMAIGARIVDARHGGRPSTRQYIIRYLGYYVATLPLGLGLIWVGLDPRKQGWHDKLAGTSVLKTASSADNRGHASRRPESRGWKDE